MIRYLIIIAFLCCTPLSAEAKQKPLINILFIGNSYTYYNNMPKILEAMINKNKESPIRANIQSIVQGGADYKDHWDGKKAAAAIKNGTQWHYVILQNQSNWASHEPTRRNAHYYARQFANEINAIGAVPVIFVTWPKELNSPHYKKYSYLKSFGHSYRDLNTYSTILAKKISAQTVPVNDHWVSVLQNYSGVKLYDKDGSHPSLAGSYLSALVFYKFFTGKPLQNPKLSVKGLAPQITQALQYSVAKGLDSKK